MCALNMQIPCGALCYYFLADKGNFKIGNCNLVVVKTNLTYYEHVKHQTCYKH